MYPVALDTFSWQETIEDLCVERSHQMLRLGDFKPLVILRKDCLLCTCERARLTVSQWPQWKRQVKVTKYSRCLHTHASRNAAGEVVCVDCDDVLIPCKARRGFDLPYKELCDG